MFSRTAEQVEPLSVLDCLIRLPSSPLFEPILFLHRAHEEIQENEIGSMNIAYAMDSTAIQ